ncbi:MAG TPA: AMP-binding protein [Stellaceae bacterium]
MLASDFGDADTFPKLLARNAVRFAARPAYRHKDRGIWHSWSWAEVEAEVRAFAIGLSRLGLKRGDTLAIVGNNRPKLYWAFLAAQWLGAVPVPVYADAIADEMAYVLAHADARIAVAQDQEQVDKIIAIAARVPALRTIVYDEPRGLREYDHASLHALDEIIAAGHRAFAEDPALDAWLAAEMAAGTEADISVILYTSGTTGRPKGVEIAAGRAIAAVVDSIAFDRLDETDEVLAYLPLAWVGDHYLTFAQGLSAGYCVSCPESPETVLENLREIGPTFYFGPPRIFETLLTTTTVRMADAGAVKRVLYRFFIGVARNHGEKILNREPVPFHARLLYALGRVLIYDPFKNVQGFSRVRVAYTAGEAIGPDLFAFYRSIGLNLKQFYGQTEAFLYLTAQLDGEIRADTVGRVSPHVDLRIAADGEVQYKSPGQFVGYLKEPEKTADAMTPDGFVKTGDAGFFDEAGQLHIIDRAKDVGRLRGGALFAPKYIENKLKFFPNIREAVAFGDGRDFVTCLLNIDLTAVGDWAERNGVIYGSYQELAGNDRVIALLAAHVRAVNRDLAAEPATAAAQIRRFLVLHKELDADDGELTRTQKVRRGFIADRYAVLMEALFSGAVSADISTEVMFDDGRKGIIAARIRICDVTAEAAPAELAA